MTTAYHNYPDVIIHTGNLLRSNRSRAFFSKNALTRRGHKNEELVSALNNLKQQSSSDGAKSWNHLDSVNRLQDFQAVRNEENEIAISAKIFLSYDSEPTLIKDAVEQLEKSLDLGERFVINSLILSFPKGFKVDEMVKYYAVAEHLVKSKQLMHIGIADLCQGQIEQLKRLVTHQPDIIQINFTAHRDNCNSSLAKWAAQEDLLTLIHTDCTPFITTDTINEITGSDNVKSVDAVIRYSVTAKSRSVLLAKGYLLFLEPNMKDS